jgi:hypothetical protein
MDHKPVPAKAGIVNVKVSVRRSLLRVRAKQGTFNSLLSKYSEKV